MQAQKLYQKVLWLQGVISPEYPFHMLEFRLGLSRVEFTRESLVF